MNFKKLKELILYSNEISDINLLKNLKFDKLEYLDLSYNPLVNDNYDIIIQNLKVDSVVLKK